MIRLATGLEASGYEASLCAAKTRPVLLTRYHLLEDYSLLMLLDRDTRRSPRTRVLAVITRRSAHCSLLRTHKPGSPLLPCLGHTPMPLAPVPQPILDCSKSASSPRFTNPYSISPDPEFLGPGMSSESFSDTTPCARPTSIHNGAELTLLLVPGYQPETPPEPVKKGGVLELMMGTPRLA